MKLDALFFAAHPDDAELCSAGTLLKIAKTGRKCGIIDLTEGELSTRGTHESRQTEAKKAASLLGLAARENLHIKDGNIENSPENRLKVITEIRKYRPEIIFIPHFNDRHPDHKNTYELVRESAFFSGLDKISTEAGSKLQEAYRPKKNFYYMQTYTFEPSFIVDISAEFETKMKAIGCYATQFYTENSGAGDADGAKTFISGKEFIEFIEARAEFYGFQIGAKYGEPFYTEEKINFSISNLFA